MVNLKTLSKQVKKVVGKKNLVSIMVFGSYARGDYNGDSDVDLIVVVKDKTKELVKELNDLEDDLSVEGDTWLELRIARFLNLIGFKKNIFLFDEGGWRKKRFNFCDSRLLSKLLIPKGVIWSNIKREGKVVYGEDLIKDLNPSIGFWDKFKAPLPGVGACLMAAFLFLFNKKKAVSLAQTGLRWTYMNVKGVLRRSNINSIWGNLREVLRVALDYSY
ncbi:hypothetical protein GF352_00645 [archaeon]|nr:hypothetical protein [archaeon]